MIDIVVLAAGQGKRMGGPIPKALVPVKGRPMVSYVLKALEEAQLNEPVVVVGYSADSVRKALGDSFRYAEQTEQLGTGHAVRTGLSAVNEDAQAVIVVYCDQPLISSETLRALAATHKDTKPAITMATVKVDDFNEWRAPFYDFGRIVRNAQGSIEKSVERKDATPEQLAITELNPCYFCFDKQWLTESLPKLSNTNSQKEYYLTDLVAFAIKEGKTIAHVTIPAHEALGANTPEQLMVVEKFLE